MRAFLALGSNLPTSAGGPRETLLAAARELGGRPGIRIVRRSRVYRAAPVGPVAQPDFANAVVEVESSLAPEELLREGLELERRFGRTRGEPGGPRTLDVDLLLAGAETREGGPLELPHPRLADRRFVLVPLAEIAPDALHPRLGRSARELLAACPDASRVEPWEAEVGAGR